MEMSQVKICLRSELRKNIYIIRKDHMNVTCRTLSSCTLVRLFTLIYLFFVVFSINIIFLYFYSLILILNFLFKIIYIYFFSIDVSLLFIDTFQLSRILYMCKLTNFQNILLTVTRNFFFAHKFYTVESFLWGLQYGDLLGRPLSFITFSTLLANFGLNDVMTSLPNDLY